MKTHKGFTLVEMMTVLVVLAIIVTMAVPGMNGYLENNRLRGVTSQFYADVQFARSESIKRNSTISVSLTSNAGATWCYGINETPGCDCTITDTTNASACTLFISGTNVLKVGSSAEFSGISMTSPNGTNQTYSTFDPIRGTALPVGVVIFQSANGRETHVNVSVLGKISACSPTGSNYLSGYSTC